MKKQFSLLLLIAVLPLSLWATHNRSGEMTYRQTGQNTIELTITTYTKTSGQSGQADRDRLTVDWGDGSPTEDILRTNFVSIFNDIQENIYVGTHSYPGANPIAGQPYVISMQDPNRNDNILNINGGASVNVAFFLQTEVFLFNPSFFGFNSSPILLEKPVDFGVVGQVFQHTPNGFDPDGDSIAYELITPMQDRGINVPGYQLVTDISPGANNQFSFDVLTGLFTWNAPQQAGEYNIAILVKSYRNGQYLGGIVRDIQIKIESASNRPPELLVIEDICIEAGTLIEFDAEAWDIDLPPQTVTLTATGGAFSPSIVSPATFTNVSGTAPLAFPLTSQFRWQTVCEHIQQQPWQIVFKAKDNYTQGSTNASLATFKVLRITIIAPPPQNLQATVTTSAANLTWDAPYVCENAVNFFGFTVWRKTGCDNFVPDSCQLGLAGQGYTQLNTGFINTATGGSYRYTDNTIQSGTSYSYRILGEFATPIYYNGNVTNYHSPVSGKTSEEVCIATREDLPTIINVDVESTDLATGEILVRWTKPIADELDTLLNLPPYRYELYESDDMAGNNFGANPIFTSPSYSAFYLANDTFFTATGLNTVDNPYSYHIKFFTGTDTIGTTKEASSIYLEVAATNQQNNLTWTEMVPWQNTAYVVYQELPLGSNNYVSLDTVTIPAYQHSGLINGDEYCYRVKSIGSYNTNAIPDTLLNKSQKACGIPLDTIAPCPPDASAIVAISSCNTLQDDSNNPDRQPCQGNITNPDFLYNEITWSNNLDTCASDVAKFKVYFAPYCDGNYTLVYESQDLTDTSFQHVPSPTNLAGCYYITSLDSVEVNGGGNESDPSNVIRTDNCPFYDLPNTFTPNGDGSNDFFKPCLIYRYIRTIDFKVTNRWGQVVFETNDPAINWDGKDQNTGQDLPEGVYFYTCSVEQNCLSCEAVKAFKGYIHIIRAAK
ncbi:MAG: internalin, putative [uncultured Aureispira sp.]|uniref:Internalin, putative n=1 Tax=uncultured Aureispira sp. TaxID=1331704 RepID=A0A6S6TYN7_9BACT|nr:MAG: internalin, putative [uncultured Aureispira sp.]